MNLQHLLYLYPMLLAALLSAGIAFYTWQRRDVAGAATFAVFMIDVAILSLMTGFLELSHTNTAALNFYKLRYLSITTIPVLILIFSLQFSNRDRGLSGWRVLLLFVIPIATQTILWLKPEIFVKEVTFRLDGSLMMIENDTNGFWFYVHLLYSLVMVLIGFLLVLVMAIQSAHIYRWQAIALLVGGLPPLVISAFLATFFEHSSALLTPISFFVMGLVYTWALFRYRLLDLVPVAHSMLIGLMNDGMLVFDNQQRILEINRAAESFLDVRAGELIGKIPRQLTPPVNDMIEHFFHMPDRQGKIEVGEGENLRHLEVRLIPITDRRDQPSGCMVILHDISELFNTMQRLEVHLHEIEALQNELKEQAIHDPLTGLYNRRYLQEAITHEFARAQREDYSTSIIMIDIDHFKQVNDTYGHAAGDLVLQHLADYLSQDTRQMDTVCRFGGEEILIMLPNTTRESAFLKAQTWQQFFQDTPLPHQGTEIRVTLSIGVAAFPHDGKTTEEVTHAADRALYTAKNRGRNRVELSSDTQSV